MRILVLSNLYPPYTIGGYEQACRDTVEGLRERGHHVEVLTSTYGVQHPAVAQGVHRVLEINSFWGGRKIHSESLPLLWRWNWTSTRHLRNLLKILRPDLVYVWNLSGLSHSLLTLVQRTRVPMVMNIQDNWIILVLPRDPWLEAWAYQSRSGLRRGAKEALRKVVNPLIPTDRPSLEHANAHFVSKAISDIYTQNGGRFACERVIYNGLDLAHFSAVERDWSDGTRKLLYLSQLVPWKGAHTAIEALALLVRRFGREVATLTLVGTGHDEGYLVRLRHMVVDYGLEDLVSFRGPVLRDETTAVYAEHDIFLFPSSWIEGFSLALLEALACGLPTVGTATGGSAEILQDGVNALVVPPDDPDALADRVGRLIGDPARARRMGDAAARMVRRRFDQRQIISQVEAYLEEVRRAGATVKR